jgi:protein TonB
MVRILIYIVLLIPVSLSAQDNDTIILGTTFAEVMPKYQDSVLIFIGDNMHYPASAIKDSIEGTVFVEFEVDTCGRTVKHKIIHGIREDLNKEALRVTRLVVFTEPAFQRGKPIEIHYIVPVVFKLPYKKDE